MKTERFRQSFASSSSRTAILTRCLRYFIGQFSFMKSLHSFLCSHFEQYFSKDSTDHLSKETFVNVIPRKPETIDATATSTERLKMNSSKADKNRMRIRLSTKEIGNDSHPTLLSSQLHNLLFSRSLYLNLPL